MRSEKRFILASVSPTKYTLGDRAQSFKLKSLMFHKYCCSACVQNFSKNIDNCLSYYEI